MTLHKHKHYFQGNVIQAAWKECEDKIFMNSKTRGDTRQQIIATKYLT